MGLKDQASLPQHGDRGHVDGECGCEILLLDVGPSAAKEIESLLGPKGYSFRVYSSLEKLLEMGRSDGPSCLILGCGADGGEPRIEVLDEFRKRSWNLPVVVIAKQWDIDLVVNSLRAGADGFVPWPFEPAKFLDSICHALKYERHLGYNGMSVCESRSLLASLHSRELEVVRCVVDGLTARNLLLGWGAWGRR